MRHWLGNNRWSAALLALLALAAWLLALGVLALAALPRCPLGDDSDLSCARGFQTRERAGSSLFRWSDGTSLVLLPAAGYGRGYAAELALRSGRALSSPPLPAGLGVNGAPGLGFRIWVEPRRYRLLLRPGLLSGDQLYLQIASATFAPGSGRRTLGAIVGEVRLLPLLGPRWPGPLLVLSLLGLGLVAARFGAARRATSLLLGLACMLAAGLLGIALPISLAYLPALSVILGLASLALARPIAGSRGAAPVHGTCAAGHSSDVPDPRPLIPEPCASTQIHPLLLLTALAGGALELALLALESGPGWRAPLLLLAQALPALLACGWLLRTRREAALPDWRTLLALTLLTRLVSLALRLLSGNTYLDSDVDLFYAYGVALRQIGLPVAEYPSGALLAWSALAWLAGDSRERFALLLPLFNTLCDMGSVAALLVLGRCCGRLEAARVAAAFYALGPLLLPFVFAKYDAWPTLLLLAGLACYALAASDPPLQRTALPAWMWYLLAGGCLGLGAATKWAPLLAAPVLGLALLRRARYGSLALLAAGLLLAVTLPSLPFALADSETFLAPYKLQGSRSMTGQSIWFLLALALDPALLRHLPRAWSSVRSDDLPIRAMVLGQAAALLVLLAPALVRPAELRRDLALAALTPALFLLLNRVYSPQYLVTISAALLAAALLLLPLRRMAWFLAVLTLAQGANLVTWPLLSPYWLPASGLMFAALLALFCMLAAHTWQPGLRPVGSGTAVAKSV